MNLHRSVPALLVGLMMGGCSDDAPPPAPAGSAADPPDCALSVGWDPWAPYQFEAADGTVQGLDVDVMRALASDVGCVTHFRRGNWLDLLHQLRDGRVDVLLAATVIPEREHYAWFSRPYRSETFAIHLRRGDLQRWSALDLPGLVEAGLQIGYTEGYYYGPVFQALSADEDHAAQFIPASVVELNYSRLLDHSIDALIDDPVVATSVIRRKGWEGQVAALPRQITSGDVSLMFSRASVPQSRVEAIDRALQARRADGRLEALMARYRD